MPLLPNSINSKVVSKRQAAWGESMAVWTVSFMVELQRRQTGIQTTFGDQLIVGALFDQSTVV
jgi:hypothetical protein